MVKRALGVLWYHKIIKCGMLGESTFNQQRYICLRKNSVNLYKVYKI